MVIQGIIRPPPEIRAVADRTALFVSKNGRAFEQRILNSEKGKTPKFAFLHETSPFHAYYEHRIRFYEEGGQDGDENEQSDKAEKVKNEQKVVNEEEEEKKEEKREKVMQKKASAVDPIAKMLLAQRTKIGEDAMAPPMLLGATIAAPSKITSASVEIMKLVAQLTALNGSFLRELSTREWNNPIFGFIQPRHAHFAYFTALVDCYRRMIHLGEEDGEEISSSSSYPGILMKQEDKKQKCVEVAAYRAEYDRHVKERKRNEEQQTENGTIGTVAAVIDWHDFVVVETIEFPVDEIVTPAETPPLPPPPPPIPALKKDEEDVMEESDEDEEEEDIKIVPEYKPRIMPTQATLQDASRTHVLDPISGKSIPIADMSEHMRIQLLDPKWAKEKARFLEKQKETNFVKGQDIAENISKFVDKKRDEGEDMFGSLTEEELLHREADSKKRLEEANRIIREQAVQQPQPKPQTVLPVKRPPPPPPPPVTTTVTTTVTAPPPPPPPPITSPPIIIQPPEPKKPRLLPPPPIPPTPPTTTIPPPPPPPTTDPPPTTKQTLLSESEFLSTLPSPTISLQVQIPSDSNYHQWNLHGQTLTLSSEAKRTVKSFKEELQQHLNDMPVNKMQLKEEQRGFLKDDKTFAALNIGPSGVLDLIPKVRGGRK